jgi:ABC-type uncharacterized transport system auxiliary subunit
MVARAFLMTAVAIALCACASTAPQRTNLQNAVYMVGDNTQPVRTSASVADPKASQGEYSVVKRVYWFFAGR